jgi:hypothetical protein
MAFFSTKIGSITCIIFGMSISACGDLDNRAIDQKEVAQEIRDRKPKRITEKELNIWVGKKGQKLCLLAQAELYRGVKRAIESKKISSIAEFDKITRPQIVDSLSKAYGIEILYYTFERNSLSNTTLNSTFEKYKSEEITEASVQSDPKTQKIFYFAPIFLENQIPGIWLISFPRKQALRWYDYKEMRQ